MIRFQDVDPGLKRIADLVKRNEFQPLLDTLYVFGANDSRPGLIYLSPDIPNATRVASFLSQQLGWDVWIESIGNPPQKNWVAFHKKLRDSNPLACCKICMFVERAVNNLILW